MNKLTKLAHVITFELDEFRQKTILNNIEEFWQFVDAASLMFRCDLNIGSDEAEMLISLLKNYLYLKTVGKITSYDDYKRLVEYYLD